MKYVSVLFLSLLLAVTASAAAIIEDFEHGNKGLYTAVGGSYDNFSIIGAAAHDGALGAAFGTGAGLYWWLRNDLGTAPGNAYRAFFQLNDQGRVYVGVGASGGGAYSMVAGSNTNQIILQDNTGWGFGQLAATSYTFSLGTWYQLELDWGLTGMMTVRLYDEPGLNLLAATTPYATGFTTAGGLAIRGFTDVTGMQYMDTIHGFVIPEPSTMALFAGGLAFLAFASARRRQ